MWPDLIYSSGHEVAGSLENCTSRPNSQTKVQLLLRTETKKMEGWPQSCAVAVVSSISGGARGWSPESREQPWSSPRQWRWHTCSPGATVYSRVVLAPCHGYTLLPTALSCQHPGITLLQSCFCTTKLKCTCTEQESLSFEQPVCGLIRNLKGSSHYLLLYLSIVSASNKSLA